MSLKNFEQFLLDRYKAGVSPVLLVDEAQNMTLDMLRLVHHLFNFSTNTEFLIQMALFGQNELHDKITRYVSLKSRMAPAWLKLFDKAETKQMLEFRWRVAGGSTLPFTDEAIGEIYRLTRGNPRDICKLSDAVLLWSLAHQRRQISKDGVLAASAEVFVTDTSK
jgi:general secretion pathway protein A